MDCGFVVPLEQGLEMDALTGSESLTIAGAIQAVQALRRNPPHRRLARTSHVESTLQLSELAETDSTAPLPPRIQTRSSSHRSRRSRPIRPNRSRPGRGRVSSKGYCRTP